MATHIILLNWTDQGIRNVRDTVDRAQQAKGVFKEMGVDLQQVYWTSGRFDIVGICEAPDAETLSAAILKLASTGNLRTETMRAFDEGAMRGILEKLG